MQILHSYNTLYSHTYLNRKEDGRDGTGKSTQVTEDAHNGHDDRQYSIVRYGGSLMYNCGLSWLSHDDDIRLDKKYVTSFCSLIDKLAYHLTMIIYNEASLKGLSVY